MLLYPQDMQRRAQSGEEKASPCFCDVFPHGNTKQCDLLATVHAFSWSMFGFQSPNIAVVRILEEEWEQILGPGRKEKRKKQN
jgi:hypothetical protein